MHLPKSIVFVLALFLAGIAHAQKKSPRISRYTTQRITRSKAAVMCPLSSEGKYPYQGIGFKMGDPFALTYKYYPSKHFTFALDAGKSASGLYNRYYRKAFNGYMPDSITNDPTKSKHLTYLSHRALSDWFVEAKFLYQWDAQKLAQGLQLYAGLGEQLRNARIKYDYSYTQGITSITDSKFGQFTKNRFTYGSVIILGFEYSYFTLPISAFIEVEWYTDTFLDPGYQRFQGGVGIRYIW